MYKTVMLNLKIMFYRLYRFHCGNASAVEFHHHAFIYCFHIQHLLQVNELEFMSENILNVFFLVSRDVCGYTVDDNIGGDCNVNVYIVDGNIVGDGYIDGDYIVSDYIVSDYIVDGNIIGFYVILQR